MQEGYSRGANDDLPLLPRGIVLFESLPLSVVVIEALGPALGDGIVVVRSAGRAGVVLVRSGHIVEIHAVDHDHRVVDGDSLQRIQQWDDASVSAHRLDAAVLDVISTLLGGATQHLDLRLEWIDWARFVDDLRRNAGTVVVEVATPQGRGVTSFRGGAHVTTYTDTATGEPTLLDALASGKSGTIRVRRSNAEPAEALDSAMLHLFGRPQPVITRHDIAAHQDSRAGAHELGQLAPAIKELARARLHRSADRVERLVDSAVTNGRPLESIAQAVRDLPVRGVTQATMQALADEMLALARASSHGQSFLPA